MRSITSNLNEKLQSKRQTPANNADPKMSVKVSRARSTIMDSDYWLTETIREKDGLGDISIAVRRLVPYGHPDRIYEIHIDDSIVKTTIREYPDLLSEGWKHQFELGVGLSVGIAFDGGWEMHRKKWRIVTDEKPYIFWVDSNNVLWVQKWDHHQSRTQLAASTLKVKACRGWKSKYYPDRDQGVVVAYIKSDGKVYYRNWCQQSDLSFFWEPEKVILEFDAIAESINLFITNDYRLGFMIEDNLGQVHWLITHRNWSGMASPSETISVGLGDITFEVHPIGKRDLFGGDENLEASIADVWFNVAEPIYPVALELSNDNATTIRLTFSHVLDVDLSTVAPAFTIKDTLNAAFHVVSTSAGSDNTELVFTVENFGSASGDMTITYDRSVMELDSINQGSRFALESFALSFTPVLAPPEGYLKENLTAFVTPTFTVAQVYRSSAFETENMTTGLVFTFVVTKIGTNPL